MNESEETRPEERYETIPASQFQPKPWKHQSSDPINLIISDIELK